MVLIFKLQRWCKITLLVCALICFQQPMMNVKQTTQTLRKPMYRAFSRCLTPLNDNTSLNDNYTRLVLHCLRTNDCIQAKKLESDMQLHHFKPEDTFIHNQLLHLYAKCGKLSDAQNLFDKMSHRDVNSWNALLSAYAKAGLVEHLYEVFDQMPRRDSVSYNTLITCFAKKRLSGRALRVLVRMQEDGFQLTQHTYVNALQACSQLLDFRLGKQVHGRVVVGNFVKNAFVWNALTDMYAKCGGDIDRARWLFDGMIEKNVVSWNLMISGYVKMGKLDECTQLFDEMQLFGLKPDQITVSNVLKAYIQSGRLDEARDMFSKMPEKDKICWTTMIAGYAQNGREEGALMLFGDMLRASVRPDSFTISSVVSSCAKLASLCHGQVVHGKLILMGVDADMLVSSALVDMYCKCGVTLDAWDIFETMPVRNLITWNAMILGYAQNGQAQEALALYERMLQDNLKPDNISFVGILSACKNADMVKEGQKYFDSITERGMTPTLDHYACMVTLLGRSGSVDKAVDLIKGMPHKPDYLIWSALLSVCGKDDMKIAELAASHLFRLDPQNAGPYIMLSNLYAACGMWKEKADVRSLMKNKCAKKFAAYSWVEVENEVHRFVSEDRTHPEVERIYDELNRLISKLRRIGYNPDTSHVLHNVGEEEKFRSISCHSEKLAVAYALIRKPNGVAPIRIMKNIRICNDCHAFMKFASITIGRPVIVRDSNRFHHFFDGKCSCKDHW
ncbi:pentatricopeptide repeat-containing protein At4g16835, mitochondrial-like [Lotus japonicus]|uniref:pentatricopeptide repeat-containing protein At4g16835, mitochondrial-like n=1 Tax=Lotus japonicus TaxID=34305 RepID=UPI002590A735|nr:pentatricopeptide repeat-containing protein At4g16835, mitochondrial-like [Lotus japonicus]